MAFIILPQTSPATSEWVDLTDIFGYPHVFVSSGEFTDDDDDIVVEIRHCDGSYGPFYGEDRKQLVMDRRSPPLIVAMPITIRFVKPETTTACGVERICCTGR